MIVTKSLADRIKAMPMLSTVSTKLLDLLNDENHSIKDVAHIVEVDASLTTKILRAANSVAYAPRVPVTSISASINKMGEKVVTGIAVEACSAQVFKKPLEGYDSAEGELWDHSLCAAIGARVLASYAREKPSANTAFTAGLLHDIGKSVISELLKGNTDDMVAQFDDGRADSFLTAEQKIARIDHADLGYELAIHWKLPESLALAIKYHHKPQNVDDKYRNLVYAVHLGDIIAMMAGIGTGVDCLSYKIAEDYNDYINLSEEQLSVAVMDVQEEFIKTKQAILGQPVESE
jgi:putative nucleotidyltransferase with HDIG domain